jgi:2-oxoisovalerate dehydrogenase E2 component (dihydrolipoyl transacylase)
MAEHVIKMPDVGEGVAEAELVEWHVKVGDPVREDEIVAAVMTDKATVEIPSPVEGTIAWLGGEIGDTIAVGSALVKIETAGGAAVEEKAPAPAPVPEPVPEPAKKPAPEPAKKPAPVPVAARPSMAGAPRPEGAPARLAGRAPEGAGSRRRFASGRRHRPGRAHHP